MLEDKKLVELEHEKKDNNFSVGDIYLGRVKKIMPSLNACFVDIGYEKDAFLHYLDLGPQFQSLVKYIKGTLSGKQPDPLLANFESEKDINKNGKITQVISNNQWLLVQIAKEPISTKGPRIACELSLAGRFVVLVPFADMVSISQKIKSSEERTRLRRLAQSIKPKNFGLILRTVAEGKKVAEIDKDVQELVARWKSCYDLLKVSKPPQKVLGEINRTSTILRDMLNPDFNSVHVNDPAMYEEVRSYLRGIAPEQENIVKLYKGKIPVFENFGIEKQIKTLFGKTVALSNSAYIVIEHTEAMHVIDVNSGGRNRGAEDSQESNALQTNMMAAAEIARQLRLRDMGGIVVVDFIDMKNPVNRKTLYDHFRNEMKKDRARHTILPPSKFGLVQLTRERVRPETKISTAEKCPACDGTGEIKASILFVDDIENNIRYFSNEQNEKSLTLNVHPYIAAYLTQGIFSLRYKWKRKYKVRLKINPVTSYHFMEYHFLNKNGEEIKI